MRRRDFLRAGMAGGAALGGLRVLAGHAGGGSVALIADPEDPVASSAPGQWAIGELRRALAAAGLTVVGRQELRDAPSTALCIVTGGARGRQVSGALAGSGVTPPDAPEGMALAAGSLSGRPVTVACGHDARGLVCALGELTDRVRHASGWKPRCVSSGRSSNDPPTRCAASCGSSPANCSTSPGSTTAKCGPAT